MRIPFITLIVIVAFSSCQMEGEPPIEEAPVIPSITTTAIADITMTTARSGGTVTNDGGRPVDEKGICWNTAGNPTTQDSILENLESVDDFFSNITGLTPASTYYVRAYATNDVGTGYGAEVSFTTLEKPLVEFEGSAILKTQGEVDSFVEGGYFKVTGDLIIGDVASTNTSIASLEGLTSLVTIDGDLVIYGNESLNDIDGLNNLKVIKGDLRIGNLVSLQNIDGLERLEEVGGNIELFDNPLLASIDGFNVTTSMKSISIVNHGSLTNVNSLIHQTELQSLKLSECPSLENIDGLAALRSIEGDLQINNSALQSLAPLSNLTAVKGSLFITLNNDLTELEGLNNLAMVGKGLFIVNNDALLHVDALSKLTSVGTLAEAGEGQPSGDLHIENNDKLDNLNGLQNLSFVGWHVDVYYNISLVDFCGLQLVIAELWPAYNIFNNAYNPSFEDISSGNCSQ